MKISRKDKLAIFDLLRSDPRFLGITSPDESRVLSYTKYAAGRTKDHGKVIRWITYSVSSPTSSPEPPHQILLAAGREECRLWTTSASLTQRCLNPKTEWYPLRTRFLSVDPYLRDRMRDQKSYVPPFALNEVIAGGVVAEVIESRAPAFQPGNIVTGLLGWRLYSVAKAEELGRVNPNIAPVTTALGVLGMPGLTAYFGLLDIGQPQEGETVVVSGAAGAVGMTVCQIAKIKGCRVVGIAGAMRRIVRLLIARSLLSETRTSSQCNPAVSLNLRGALEFRIQSDVGSQDRPGRNRGLLIVSSG